VDRRQHSQDGQSPVATLDQLPARVVLERIPVPALAIDQNGAILFANAAFAQMVGHAADALLALKFHQIFNTMPPDESPVSVVRAHADRVVELMHADGSIVRARMSKSALMRDEDPLALATFQDLTEHLWVNER
jgi:PAS domain S-box-containing protein